MRLIQKEGEHTPLATARTMKPMMILTPSDTRSDSLAWLSVSSKPRCSMNSTKSALESGATTISRSVEKRALDAETAYPPHKDVLVPRLRELLEQFDERVTSVMEAMSVPVLSPDTRRRARGPRTSGRASRAPTELGVVLTHILIVSSLDHRVAFNVLDVE